MVLWTIGFHLFHCSGELQSAIENENYALAAQLRDDISKLEAESLAASAKALAHENAKYAFRLGQKVQHKNFGRFRLHYFYFFFLSTSCHDTNMLLLL